MHFFFCSWVIFHSVYIPQLPYPLICWWTSRLLPCPSYCKQCSNEHLGPRVSFNSGFLGVYAQQWNCWVIWQFYFQVLRNLHTVLHSGHTSLYSHQQYKRVLFSTPSPAFIVCRLFDDSHAERCEMVPHCGLDEHFLIMSNVEHLYMCLLTIYRSSLEKCLFSSLAHFLIGSFVFLVLSCMSCLYILEFNSLLSVASFAIIFPILKADFSPGF